MQRQSLTDNSGEICQFAAALAEDTKLVQDAEDSDDVDDADDSDVADDRIVI